jgi:arabinofuranosyltransferase
MERRLLTAFALAFFFILLLRTAWLSDSAYYTLRTAENASRGLGFTWNPMERVQVFEHPLWMFALTAGYRVTGEAYASALTLSIVCSLLAAALVFASAASESGVVVAAIALALSPSFLAFSTSGLEGPLVHLLIAAFALVALDDRPGRPSDRRVAALAGLAALTHLSTLLITLPLVAARLRARERRDRWILSVLWLAPCVLWIAFATWYYGTPLPNPFVARLTAPGVIARELQHGIAWLADAIGRDPLTIAVTLAGITLGLLFTRESRERQLAVGSLLFLIGIVVTGGDPMSGRWLGAPLIVSVIQVGRDRRLERPVRGGLVIATAVALVFVTPQTVLRSDAMFGDPPPAARAPVDARAMDYQATGLLTNVRQSRPPMWLGGYDAYQAWRDPARVFIAHDHPGFTGFAAGYGVYVVDTTARGDPLLARLEPVRPATDAGSWTAIRRLPEGYVASLPSHDIQLADAATANEYARIRIVTRGSLFDWRRLIAAWQLLLPSAPAARDRRSEPAS